MHPRLTSWQGAASTWLFSKQAFHKQSPDAASASCCSCYICIICHIAGIPHLCVGHFRRLHIATFRGLALHCTGVAHPFRVHAGVRGKARAAVAADGAGELLGALVPVHHRYMGSNNVRCG